ncbi:type II toxin-antitoxin system HicA family toxin [Robiginitalea sp. IMCC44478]|uniref:type II toxin-antitoxin system HicA family toxin n=1 Tax=Robiginitalea sp. IMCC44478 TaxID=3459122 RepID=UPI004042A6B9
MKCSKALAILKKHGWYVVSQKGSHLKLKHPQRKGILIFPNHGSRELGKGLQKQLFKQVGID